MQKNTSPKKMHHMEYLNLASGPISSMSVEEVSEASSRLILVKVTRRATNQIVIKIGWILEKPYDAKIENNMKNF
jgi:hypothetical protein